MKSMNTTTTAREQKQKKLIEVPRLAVSKRFGIYKKEEKKAMRASDIVDNKALERIVKTWDEFDLDCITAWPSCYYRTALEITRNLGHGPKDIEKFSKFIRTFSRENMIATKAGVFLSALVNNVMGKRFTVHTHNLDFEIDHLGYGNTRRLTVNGNCGDLLGEEMKRGMILVQGNVGNEAGNEMSGGRILVRGDAGYEVGKGMKGGIIIIEGNVGDLVGGNRFEYSGDNPPMTGGKIIVKGNAGDGVGEKMQGGEIHIEGDIGSIGNVVHGLIYHKGKLVIAKYNLHVLSARSHYDLKDLESSYKSALAILKNVPYSSKDVSDLRLGYRMRFDLDSRDRQDGARDDSEEGIFISAAINQCADRVFVIETKERRLYRYERINNVGYRNTKEVRIVGSVGRQTGKLMKEGCIIIRGDAGDETGAWMEGGSLIVSGNAGSGLGAGMSGGCIKVGGNAGHFLGQGMRGGQIHVEGRISTIGDVIHGKIYHKGKLIVNK